MLARPDRGGSTSLRDRSGHDEGAEGRRREPTRDRRDRQEWPHATAAIRASRSIEVPPDPPQPQVVVVDRPVIQEVPSRGAGSCLHRGRRLLAPPVSDRIATTYRPTLTPPPTPSTAAVDSSSRSSSDRSRTNVPSRSTGVGAASSVPTPGNPRQQSRRSKTCAIAAFIPVLHSPRDPRPGRSCALQPRYRARARCAITRVFLHVFRGGCMRPVAPAKSPVPLHFCRAAAARGNAWTEARRAVASPARQARSWTRSTPRRSRSTRRTRGSAPSSSIIFRRPTRFRRRSSSSAACRARLAS